jgi:hypothetical protein
MEVADRWIRAALLYALGDGHDWVMQDLKMVRRSAPEITCEQSDSGAEYTGRTRLDRAQAVPVMQAAYTSDGQRFDVVTGHKPGKLLTEGRRLTIFANICKWTPPRIIGDADELPPFMQARRDSAAWSGATVSADIRAVPPPPLDHDDDVPF